MNAGPSEGGYETRASARDLGSLRHADKVAIGVPWVCCRPESPAPVTGKRRATYLRRELPARDPRIQRCQERGRRRGWGAMVTPGWRIAVASRELLAAIRRLWEDSRQTDPHELYPHSLALTTGYDRPPKPFVPRFVGTPPSTVARDDGSRRPTTGTRGGRAARSGIPPRGGGRRQSEIFRRMRAGEPPQTERVCAPLCGPALRL